MKYLRITTLDEEGTLSVEQIPLTEVTGYYYTRYADETDKPSFLKLEIREPVGMFPDEFEGSRADDVAKALRLHRPPLSPEFTFGAMVHDDEYR